MTANISYQTLPRAIYMDFAIHNYFIAFYSFTAHQQ